MLTCVIKHMDLLIDLFFDSVRKLVHAGVTCVRAPPEAQEMRWLRGKNEKQNGHKQRHSCIRDEPVEENT